MKLKLSQEEMNILIETLRNSEEVRFTTTYEARVSGAVLKDFLQSMMKKSIDLKEKTSFSLDDQTILVLNYVLPQITPQCIFQQSIISTIVTKINQQCLSIS